MPRAGRAPACQSSCSVSRELGDRDHGVRPAVAAASDGKFKLAGLPPGEYYMAAVTEFEYPDLSDPSFLEQFTAGAFKITLAEGEKKVQDIRMGG